MIEIKLGDCIPFMGGMKDSSVGMIITDPPYGINFQSNMRTKTEKFSILENDNNNIRFEAYKEFPRIMKENTVAVVFCSWKNFALDYNELSKYLDIKNVIIWDKGGGGIGDLKHTFATDYEMAMIAHKGKCKIRQKRIGSVWDIQKVFPGSMIHPTQKPVELFERFIHQFTDQYDLVFDPFLGSGTSAIACMNANRNFLGVEVDEKYCKIALDRLEKAFEYTEF